MADLKFSTDAFTTAINGYREVSQSLETTKNTLVNKMNALKESWQSDAGVAFEDFYNENWVSHVSLYVTVLEQLAELLEKANSEYAELEERISQIFSE